MELVDSKTVMKTLNISRTTLYRLNQQGIPCHVLETGKKMYDIGEVKEFLERRQSKLKGDLTIGKEYTNQEIALIFSCDAQKGMRRSLTTGSLVLLSNQWDPNRLYQDYWKDGILYYTGEGYEGNQTLTRNNKTLAESPENNVKVYLFECFEDKKYRYRGIVVRCDEPFLEEEKGANGETRKVWKFPLKPIDTTDSLSEDYYEKHEDSVEEKVERMSDARVFELAEDMDQTPSERTVTTKVYSRSQVMARYAKSRANGKCELCGNDAPFEVNGKPYLEAHHLIPVSENGKDNKDNICALCPNCHRRVHSLKNPQDIATIKVNVSRDEMMMEEKYDQSEGK